MTEHGDLEKKISTAESLAKLGVLALRSVTTLAILQGVVAILFGGSLIWSFLQGNLATSPSYDYLEDTAGWPWLIGTAYLVLGVLTIYSRYSRDRWRMSTMVFATQTAFTSLFAAAHFLGTFLHGDLNIFFGPQWLYPGWAAATAVHAYFSYQAARVVGE
jgi:hypothetical protein